MEIQGENCVDIRGIYQHGFINLWSIIARAFDEGKSGLVSTVDLSLAFDVVTVDLLKIMVYQKASIN
jgi:hypothetical protein